MSDFDTILDEVEEEDAETSVVGDVSTATAGEETETEPAAPTDATAPETQVSPAAESPAPDVQLPEGYKLDALGRVHGPDGRVVSKEEAEKIKASVVPTPVASPTPETPAPVAEVPKPAETVPFQYRSIGATHELQHAKVDVTTGALTIAPEGVGQLRQQLNAAHMAPALQRRVAELESQVGARGENEVKSGALVDGLTKILQEPDEEKALVEFFQLRQNFPVLVANAKADYYEKLAKAGKPEQANGATAQPSALPSPQAANETTTDHLAEARLDIKYRSMTDADWKQYGDLCARKPYAFLRQATEQDAQQYGVQAGSVVFDTDAMEADLNDYAKRVGAAREAEAAAKKARDAGAFNAANRPTNAALPNRPKPTPAATPVAAGSQKPSWDQAVKKAWDDDEDDT